tara:strand:+ start:2092 stop:2289 length:198 start_codon:yes stop_codon:yes gene_type:complete
MNSKEKYNPRAPHVPRRIRILVGGLILLSFTAAIMMEPIVEWKKKKRNKAGYKTFLPFGYKKLTL